MKLKCLYSVRSYTVVGATVSMAQFFVISAARTGMVPLIQPVARYTQRVQIIELPCTRAFLVHGGQSNFYTLVPLVRQTLYGVQRHQQQVLSGSKLTLLYNVKEGSNFP